MNRECVVCVVGGLRQMYLEKGEATSIILITNVTQKERGAGSEVDT